MESEQSEGEEGVHERMRREMDAELWMDLREQPGNGEQAREKRGAPEDEKGDGCRAVDGPGTATRWWRAR